MANELLGLDKWTFSRLAADAGVTAGVGRRIYAEFAPETDPVTNLAPAYPLLVFSVLSSPDILGTGGNRAGTRPLLRVEVIGQGGGFAALQPIADAADAALHGAPVETVEIGAQSYEVRGCLRQHPLKRAEIEKPGGVRYNYLGGVYRLWMRAV